MIIGILGLQGCFVPHQQKFAELGIETRRVLYPEHLDDVDALVLPGGESTTMIKTAKHGLWEALRTFADSRPVWGVCAGSILMARGVTHPEQPSLDLIDIDVARNAYGSQIQSFVTKLQLKLQAETVSLPAIFIRAPRITRVGDDVTILCTHNDDPVVVESERHLTSTFHPELTDSTVVHQYFADKVSQQ